MWPKIRNRNVFFHSYWFQTSWNFIRKLKVRNSSRYFDISLNDFLPFHGQIICLILIAMELLLRIYSGNKAVMFPGLRFSTFPMSLALISYIVPISLILLCKNDIEAECSFDKSNSCRLVGAEICPFLEFCFPIWCRNQWWGYTVVPL